MCASCSSLLDGMETAVPSAPGADLGGASQESAEAEPAESVLVSGGKKKS